MNRILDTNVCIDVLRGRRKVVERLEGVDPASCYISVITEFELLQGAARAPEDRRGDEKSKVERFISCLHVLPFGSECARIAAKLNAELLNRGTPVDITDVFIAATGLHLDWTIVTNNPRDFRRMSGVKLEDWRQGSSVILHDQAAITKALAGGGG